MLKEHLEYSFIICVEQEIAKHLNSKEIIGKLKNLIFIICRHNVPIQFSHTRVFKS